MSYPIIFAIPPSIPWVAGDGFSIVVADAGEDACCLCDEGGDEDEVEVEASADDTADEDKLLATIEGVLWLGINMPLDDTDTVAVFDVEA